MLAPFDIFVFSELEYILSNLTFGWVTLKVRTGFLQSIRFTSLSAIYSHSNATTYFGMTKTNGTW